MTTPRKTAMICIEGCDGTGKSTQAGKLTEYLRSIGKNVLLTHEPTPSELGTLAKGYALRKVHDPWVMTLLFAADRKLHCDLVIRPALDRGTWVVCDRYLYSSIAYQGAEGVDQEWIRNVNACCVGPDLTLLLDVDSETGILRSKSKKQEMNFFEEEIEFRDKARKEFLKLSDSGEVTVIDANGTIDTVCERILSALHRLMGRRLFDESTPHHYS